MLAKKFGYTNSAFVTQSPQPTKTHPLFHYGGQSLLNALQDEEFVVTSSVDFDDPFEFLPRALPDDETGKLGSQVGDVELVQKASVGKFYAFCLSRKPNDIRMWAQYGDNHKGLMLTVDFRASKKTQSWLDNRMVLDVDYSTLNHRHAVHWGSDDRVNLPPDEIRSLFTIKGYDWRDQQETRVVVPNSYLTQSPENGRFKILSERLRAFIRVPQDCITKVTLGYKSSPGLLASVEKLKEVKGANWIISKVDRHPSKFEFVENVVVSR